MSIPKNMTPQRDFGAGQLARTAARRDDLDQVNAGALELSDWDWLPTNGLTRRRGTLTKARQSGRTLIVNPVKGVVHTLVFQELQFQVIDTLSGVVIHTVTGCPWTNLELDEMDRDKFEDKVIVVHQSFRPQILEYDADANLWSHRVFDFDADSGGGARTAFFRFGALGITMTVSALTGAGITITMSGDVFVDGHVGVVFRYAGRQILITAVNSPTEAIGTALEELPPTHTVPVDNADGYQLGDVVQGDQSDATGEILDISGLTLTILLTKNFGGFKNGEFIVAPEAKGTSTSASASASPGATVQWEEEFMTNLRGWPGAITRDRRRVIFSRFKQFGPAILWSGIDKIGDFLITGTADGAIFEYAPGDANVLSVTGGPDQFVLTDRGIFYIPISASNPLAPGSVEFRHIGEGGASSVRPVSTNQGIVYVTHERARLNVIAPTGQTAAPYVLRDLTRYHGGLVSGAVELASNTGDANAPGDYVFVVNGDGTLVFGRYDPENQWAGFQPWYLGMDAVSIASHLDTVQLSVEKDFGSGVKSRLVQLDRAALVDVEHQLFDAQGRNTILLDGGDVLEFDGGEVAIIDGYELEDFAGIEVAVFSSVSSVAGKVTVGANGELPFSYSGAISLSVGIDFMPKLTPFTKNFEGGEDFGQRKRRRKIGKFMVTVRESQGFVVSHKGRQKRVAAYNAGENQSLAPPKRNDTYGFRFLGRDYDPEVTLLQDVPGSLEVIEVGMEVTT